MPNKDNDKKAKLIFRLETADGKAVQRVIEGAGNIAFILDEAGILDNELLALLGYK